MYKLVALDLDGTLLKEDKTISERTKEAITEAKKRGVKIVLSTGRPVQGVKNYLEYLSLDSEDDYVVTYNGAVVQNVKGKVIAKTLITHEDVFELDKLSRNLKVNIHAFDFDGVITPKNNKYTQLEVDINHVDLRETSFDTIPDDAEMIKVLFVEEPDVLEKAIKKVPDYFKKKYTMVQSAPYFLEFLNKKVNKGTGVELLAKCLDIDKKEIICIGDAGNDVHMIKYAGLGVAMGNAFPEVKAVADYVTSTNESDGVAKVIEKFILNVN